MSTRGKDNKQHSVAIIGGGYAGLTLANYLVAATSNFSCRVLEAKDEPIPIVGTIRLPNARQVLQDLKLMSSQDDNSIFPGPTDLVDRQAFQRLLRTRIRIDYSRRIVKVVEAEECRSQQNHADNGWNTSYWLWDDQGNRHGPFHCVVLATGLCLPNHQTPKLLLRDAKQKSSSLAVLGDTRWQHETWFWDFGRRRIQRGGDIALQDARELALVLLLQQQGRPLAIPTKFRLKPVAKWYRWHASKVAFLGLLLAIGFRILLGLEKI